MNTTQRERSARLHKKYADAGIVRLTVWVPERHKKKILQDVAHLRRIVLDDMATSVAKMDKELGIKKRKTKKIPASKSKRGSKP